MTGKWEELHRDTDLHSEAQLFPKLWKEMVGKGVSEAVESILSLVARGNAVLAEVERLRDIIPLLYRYGVCFV